MKYDSVITEQGDLGLGVTPITESHDEHEKTEDKNIRDNKDKN